MTSQKKSNIIKTMIPISVIIKVSIKCRKNVPWLFDIPKYSRAVFNSSILSMQSLSAYKIKVGFNYYYYNYINTDNLYLKNLPASRAHSHRAQLVSLASLSAPRARDLIVALRAPFFLDLALRARSCALRIHLSLFLII